MLQFELLYKLQELRLESERAVIAALDTPVTPARKAPRPNGSPAPCPTAHPTTPQNQHVVPLKTPLKTPHLPGHFSFTSSGGNNLNAATSVSFTSVSCAPVSRPLPVVPFHSLKQHPPNANTSIKPHETPETVESVQPDTARNKIISIVRVVTSSVDAEGGGVEVIADMILQAESLNEVTQIVSALNPKFPIGSILNSISRILHTTG